MYEAGLPPDTARNKTGYGTFEMHSKKIKIIIAFNALSVYFTQAETSRYALKIHYHGSEKNKNDEHSVKGKSNDDHSVKVILQ